MMKMLAKSCAVLLFLGLAACDPDALPPSSVAPICKALIGPIKYNSTNHMSKRFAAALLAMDLKERNQVGRNIGCPGY